MIPQVQKLESYLAETMHSQVVFRPWPSEHDLPRYLTSAYEFFTGELNGQEVLWRIARDVITPGAAVKHGRTVSELYGGQQVVVFESLPSYVRARLMDLGVSFVVPGSYLYLPGFGADVRSRRPRGATSRDTLSPSGQLLLLSLLLGRLDEVSPRSGSEIAPCLGLSAMTISRAIAELEAHGFIVVGKSSRYKPISLADAPREVWSAAQRLLRDPAQRRLVVRTESEMLDGLPRAGLTALSEGTMLSSPRQPTFAISKTALKDEETAGLAYEGGQGWFLGEPGLAVVESWVYDPAILARDGSVDPLSLWLSLRADQDERVKQALANMMEDVQWSRG